MDFFCTEIFVIESVKLKGIQDEYIYKKKGFEFRPKNVKDPTSGFNTRESQDNVSYPGTGCLATQRDQNGNALNSVFGRLGK
ncbi:hypothetical protein CEXT_338981 [Caerostris extrusa]|uniref:Uncharacterized protein n=1 Tax=Caerostris extrusa TaxID=172846 RepID=A0AAV4QYH1_CAEEX|nr:hypothetical protein CEXT_338981 [Caerostris extrusa]